MLTFSELLSICLSTLQEAANRAHRPGREEYSSLLSLPASAVRVRLTVMRRTCGSGAAGQSEGSRICAPSSGDRGAPCGLATPISSPTTFSHSVMHALSSRTDSCNRYRGLAL